ncbi:MAG: ArsR family transcriptional regulator, partial [Halobaculum sp.]
MSDSVESADTEVGTDADASSDTETVPAASTERVAPDDAFAALGDETRLRAIRAVAKAAEPPTFTDLFDASESETSAGFAYHLRQVVGPYLSKDEATEEYTLTSAGRAVARALDAGTFTERVDRDPETIPGTCPVCDTDALTARVTDNVVGVACTDCATELLSLPFPPNGVADRETTEIVSAFD